MKVKIIKASENTWYSECIGQIFHVFQLPKFQQYFLNPILYILPEDVEEVKEGEGLLPSITHYGIA